MGDVLTRAERRFGVAQSCHACEIEEAIRHAKSSVSRSAEHRGIEQQHTQPHHDHGLVPKNRHPDPKVTVRARVPRSFFTWFDQVQQTDWQAHAMLQRCLFDVERLSIDWNAQRKSKFK